MRPPMPSIPECPEGVSYPNRLQAKRLLVTIPLRTRGADLERNQAIDELP